MTADKFGVWKHNLDEALDNQSFQQPYVPATCCCGLAVCFH